ncbi:MAG TPA: beta-propeller fold lactonase family protein [Solirubrobacteraceae bacterium]|nr:beta-propeller fold lactonase family protein [Solirubrobacteraceae bacterium]
MRSARLISLLMVASCLALLARLTTAMAYFTGQGSGAAAASLESLSAPSGVAASAVTDTATINWDAASIGSSTPASEYTVERYNAETGDPVGSATCGSIAASSGSPNSMGSFTCTDKPAAGKYRYVVTAHYGGWTASSAASAAVTVHTSSTRLEASESTIPYQAPVRLTATVEGAPSETPGGTVEFRAGERAISGCERQQLAATATATCETSFSAIGTVSVSARYRGSEYFPESTSAPIVLTVVAAEQQITLDMPASSSLGSSPVEFTASASSGLSVQVKSLSESICKVSAQTLILLRTGTCKIKASQEGNQYWRAAQAVTGTMTVYQVGTLRALGSISAGEGPARVVVSPDGLNVYVTDRNTRTITEYTRNRETGELTALGTVDSGDSPEGIVIDTNGENAYVANRYSNNVSVFRRNSTGALEFLESVDAGKGPIGIAITANGANVYVANSTSKTISEYARGSGGALKQIGEVEAGENAHGIVVAPDEEAVYVTNYNAGTVSQYKRSTSTGLLTALTPASVGAGVNPHDLAISPDGSDVYVAANTPPGQVSVFRTLTGGTLEALPELSIAAGEYSECIAISNGGNSLYVTNFESNSVSEYERVAGDGALQPIEASPEIASGKRPEGIAVSPEGNSVYVANYYEGTLSEYERER